jgi:hypothetical protein
MTEEIDHRTDTGDHPRAQGQIATQQDEGNCYNACDQQAAEGGVEEAEHGDEKEK